MEVIRYKYIFILITLSLNCVSNEKPTTNSTSSKENTTTVCPFTKIIEDIFKIHNKSSKDGIYLEDNERAKIFLNSFGNVTNNNKESNQSTEEQLVNNIIASINRIKNNITDDKSSNETKLNEAIILNIPAANKTEGNELATNSVEEVKKHVGQIKSGIEDKIDKIKLQNTSAINLNVMNETNNDRNHETLTKTSTEKTNYVEILTIEPNNTSSNNASSHNIIEVLKHLMPLFNSTLTKELHNITIIERHHNKNHSFSATKNVSTIVVTYCDKENYTKANATFDSKETILKPTNDSTDDDFYLEEPPEFTEDNNEDRPEVNLTVGEKKDIMEAAKYGMQKMHELYSVLEPKLYSMGLWLDDTNPARYVAAFNAPSEDMARYSRYGYASLQAATRLKQLTSGDSDGLESRSDEVQFPTASALRQSPLLQHCPLKGTPKCPAASKRYRTHDGTCNNVNRPRWGSTMTPVQRFLAPSYSDGLQAPRRSVFGSPLPSAREISSLVHEDQNIENPGITHLLMQWGQFLDHDVTSSSQSRGFNGSVPRCCKDGGRDFMPKELMHPECLPIAVPPSDPFYGPRGVRCLDFVRSSPAPRDDCALGWREQLNQVSAYIDGSPLYASSARQSDNLRLFRNGMLQYGRVQQRRPLLPREHKDELCRGGAVSTDCFKSGDGRVNEHPGLVAAHIVWLRQHNRMAQELAHLNPHWSDEKIYQETRKIVGAMVQHITYREFLPIVLGTEVMRLFELEPQKKGNYRGYDPKVNPSPASSFGSAAFRFGHSLVQPSMVRFDRFHRPINNNVSLHNEMTNPSNIWSMGAVDRLLLGMVNQPIQTRDEFITEELTNRLFQTPSFDFGMDLAAINIQRGRDHGVPPYTFWREPCGLSEIRDFGELFRVMPARAVRKLQTLYRHVDDIDLFTGGMAERPVVGGLVGPTFACIIAQQFSNLRKGDRFWYENGGFESSFTPAQLQQIRRISFAQILCHTLDTIDSIQPFVFLSSNNPDNGRISCQNGLLNDFDLSPWIEINSEFNNDISKTEDVDASTLKPSTQKPKRPKPTTTRKPTTKKIEKLAVAAPNKVTQKKPILTNATNTQSKIRDGHNKTDVTVKDNDNSTDMFTFSVQNIDDKLDFKNKSRRYEDGDRGDIKQNSKNPTKQYNDYDDEENVQSVQSVVINNLSHRRPTHNYNNNHNIHNYNNHHYNTNNYNRPVMTVTENIDKYTYLINYVPRPTESWRHTTRRHYDRDVVKVTYQTYDDTYRRPNRPYFNKQDDYDSDSYYQRDRPNAKEKDEFHSSARSNDDTVTTRTKFTIEKVNPTTENLYKLVTFGYVGTYKGNSDMTVEKTNKPDMTEERHNTINKDRHGTINKDRYDTINKDKHDTISKDRHDTTNKDIHDTINKDRHDTINKNRHDTINKDRHDTINIDGHDTISKNRHDMISKDFSTYDNSDFNDKTTDENDKSLKLSTFFLYETATKPYSNLHRPTRRHDEKPPNYLKTNTKYYYVKNVLHKYFDDDLTATVKNPDEKNARENYNSPPLEENLEERSPADKLAFLEDVEKAADSATKNRLNIKTKKPASPAKTPTVAFQVIPSENTPSQWAIYDEKDDLPEGLPHRMPPMKVDPYALKEIPRPMIFNKMRRRRPGRF